MRFLLRDDIETAYHSLKLSRSRSLLTTLGVAIGIASITTIFALSDGARKIVETQVADVEGAVAIIRPGFEQLESSERLAAPITSGQYNTSSLTETDVDALRDAMPDIEIAPIMTIQSNLRAGSTNLPATVVATTPEITETTKLPVRDGQFIDQKTAEGTAVLGRQLAVDLFGTDVPISQRFSIRDQTYTVIGILDTLDNPVNYNAVDFDNAAIISLDAGKLLHDGRSQIQQINLRAASQQSLDDATARAQIILADRHRENDFTIASGEAVSQPTNQLFVILSRVIAAIAAISLLVGGIGIMNIMLVSVAERTREIGIRKAVGASNAMIVTQFMVEALMMSLVGGLIGFTLGVVVAYSIGAVLYFTPVITLTTVGIVAVTAVLTGLVFGLYPAIRAARKDPIESCGGR